MPLEGCVAGIETEAYEQQGEKVDEVGGYRCQSEGSNQGWPLKVNAAGVGQGKQGAV
jgi:hypothetical protein